MEERKPSWGALVVGLILACLFAAWVSLGPGGAWIDSVMSIVGTRWKALASWYQLKLEGSTKLLAPLITIASGTYAIVKAYKYAEARLHYRLHDFLKREEQRLAAARPKLRMVFDQPGVKREFSEPAFLNSHLRNAFREMGWGSYFLSPQKGLVEYQLERAITQLERQTNLSVQRQRHFDLQLTTAHLLKGAMWVAAASEQTGDGSDERLALTNAASHFSAALQIDEHDEEALEYLSQVYIRLGQTDEATTILDKLLNLTSKQDKSLIRARALRSSARIAEGERKNAVAVRYLRKALEVLPNLFGNDRIEEAEINEAIADCQRRLGFNKQARAHWQVAQALYAVVSTDEAKRCRKVVEGKLNELNTGSIQSL